MFYCDYELLFDSPVSRRLDNTVLGHSPPTFQLPADGASLLHVAGERLLNGSSSSTAKASSTFPCVSSLRFSIMSCFAASTAVSSSSSGSSSFSFVVSGSCAVSSLSLSFSFAASLLGSPLAYPLSAWHPPFLSQVPPWYSQEPPYYCFFVFSIDALRILLPSEIATIRCSTPSGPRRSCTL